MVARPRSPSNEKMKFDMVNPIWTPPLTHAAVLLTAYSVAAQIDSMAARYAEKGW